MNDTAHPTVDPTTIRQAMRGIESAYAAGVIHPAVGAALAVWDPRLSDIAVVNLVTRSAPMGPVPFDVVMATFYNPNPEFVGTIIPGIWQVATPAQLLEAQATAFGPALAAGVAAMDPAELSELAELSRTAAQAGAEHPEGRALFAGLASLPWPTEDHLVIWHAAKLLREHRGDGHVALLTAAGLNGIEALVIHAAFDGYPPDALRLSRRWAEEPWAEAVASLRARDWLTDDELPTLSENGRQWRARMEERTDELALPAFEPLGQAGVDRMTELGRTLTQVLADADMVPAHYRPAPAAADPLRRGARHPAAHYT